MNTCIFFREENKKVRIKSQFVPNICEVKLMIEIITYSYIYRVGSVIFFVYSTRLDYFKNRMVFDIENIDI